MTKRLTIALIALVALVLVAVMPAAATYYNVNNSISKGATLYVGEQQLDLTPLYNDIVANGAEPTIGHWASGADITKTNPIITLNVSTADFASFSVDKATFFGTSGENAGLWYPMFANGTANTSYGLAFTAKDPSLVVDVWDFNTTQLVTGKSIIQGDYLTFRITTNLNEVYNLRKTNLTVGTTSAIIPGNADIRLKSESGNLYSSVYTTLNTQVRVGLTNVTVNQGTWFLGTTNNLTPATDNSNVEAGWLTSAIDTNGQQAYPSGVYSVYVESRINGMKDNYQLPAGGDYTGKTVSATGQVTIASNTVKITANKDSVVRSKPFSITLTGRANTVYHIWVKGTTQMDGTYDNQPPMITPNQVGVTQDTPADYVLAYSVGNDGNGGQQGNFPNGYAGSYMFQNNGSVFNLAHNVANVSATGMTAAQVTALYANVTLNPSGTRTVQFTTTNMTKAQKYTIRVEQMFGNNQYKSDEVDVKVEKGAVTIVAAGDQSYYLGEEIKFSGTNTESTTTYLFIVGPNLPEQGAIMVLQNPRYDCDATHATAPGVHTNAVDGFVQADVLGDNTWSYKWGTASVALDAGTYTIYAVSQPREKNDANPANGLGQAAYGTVSIIIKKPFISATASQSTVAKGDAVYITGTAQGQPSSGINIWILGKNYAMVAGEAVNSDASFSYELKKEDTHDLYAGQYFIVAQHPMQNNVFDVRATPLPQVSTSTNPSIVYTVDQQTGVLNSDFKLTGPGSLQGSDAAEALIEAINDANVDDTYTKLQILIEEPVITIDTIGDRHVGDKFTITATTNLAVDDEVLFEVYSSSFQPTQKSQSGEFSGASGTVKVTKGDSGLNKLSFDVDASTFKPDEYLVKASAVLQEATGTALFNVLEAQAPTATPTKVANVTAAQTTVATTVPTTVATPTKTPTQPGFGALVALIGLGAVALLVVRRH